MSGDIPGSVPGYGIAERDPLLDELAALFDQIDPVPDHVLAAADAAVEVVAAWRGLGSVRYRELLRGRTQPGLGVRARVARLSGRGGAATGRPRPGGGQGGGGRRFVAGAGSARGGGGGARRRGGARRWGPA